MEEGKFGVGGNSGGLGRVGSSTSSPAMTISILDYGIHPKDYLMILNSFPEPPDTLISCIPLLAKAMQTLEPQSQRFTRKSNDTYTKALQRIRQEKTNSREINKEKRGHNVIYSRTIAALTASFQPRTCRDSSLYHIHNM